MGASRVRGTLRESERWASPSPRPSPRKSGERERAEHMVTSSLPRSSCEQPVHEPARSGGLARIESLAVEPEAVAGLVLDQIVVARRRAGAVMPPFAGDALGALRLGTPMGHAAPAEAPRRAFGDEGRDLRGLGAREQEKRARPGLVRRGPGHAVMDPPRQGTPA